MPISQRIENGIVFREATGEISLQEMMEAIESLRDHPDFEKGMSVIWDLMNASFVKLFTEDLFQLQGFISVNAEWRGSNYKVAYVVSRDLEYGVSRMMASIFRGKPPKSRQTFYSMSEALDWINVPLEAGWNVDEV